jgi:hypothetical protein
MRALGDGTTSRAPSVAPKTEPLSFEAFFATEHARLQRALFVLTGSDQARGVISPARDP